MAQEKKTPFLPWLGSLLVKIVLWGLLGALAGLLKIVIQTVLSRMS